MRNDSRLRVDSFRRSASDGWLGTRELPGYRAGDVVAKLADLPQIDPQHLYFDLLLLDANGELRDNHSGPCFALARGPSLDERSLDERSRFVRVVAELVRHAPSQDRGLAAIGQVLTFIRERGVESERVLLAAQLLDDACSERAVEASLSHLLELSLGADEAPRTMCDVVFKLARESANESANGFANESANDAAVSIDCDVDRINSAGLEAQVSYVVRTVGKTRARRYLRDATTFEIVPTPEMFGI
jgi:hypothetical protein